MSATYGIKTQRVDGSVMMDGLTRGGVFRDILTMAQGTSGTKSYPDTSGSSLYFYTVSAASHTVSVGTDASGAGCINWTATGGSNGDSRVYVFASKVVTADTYGIVVVNDQGETLADHGYPAPQYIDKVALNTTSTSNYVTPDGYTAYLHDTPMFTMRDSADKFVLVAMPDSGSNDTWYAISNECIPANFGPISLRVTVYSKTTTYAVPSVHIYAINHPIPSSATYGIQLHDAAQALTWDSSMESVSVRDVLNVAYPDPGGTTTYSLSVGTLPGISIPFYYLAQYSGSTSTRYVGAAKKVGSQLTFGLIKDGQSANSPIVASYKLGSQSGRYCPVVDLSQLGASAPIGTPGGTTSSPPKFTTQPQSVTLSFDQQVTFTSAASGAPAPTYQWYWNDAAVPGATGASFQRYMHNADNGSYAYCVATNAQGATRSQSAYVNYTFTGIGPQFTGYGPSSESVASGATVSFYAYSVAYDSSGTPTVYLRDPNGVILATGSGSVSATVVITAANAGTYVFVANNSAGGASQPTTISIAGTGGGGTGGGGSSAPVITAASPQSETVNYGDAVTFSMTASGSPPPACTITGPAGQIASGSGTASATITALDTNAGAYTFTASSSAGTASQSMTLGVNTNSQAPAITAYSPGSDTSVNSGNSVSFSMSASGTGVQCQISGPQGVLATGYGSTQSQAVINASTAGTYTFTASNAYGTVTRSVTISMATAAPDVPVISQNPSSVSVVQDGSASMSCGASPATAYWWYRDGEYVDNTPTLSLNTHALGTFTYQCVVYNGSSSTPSSTATLTVTAPPAVPYPSYNNIGGFIEQDYGNPCVLTIGRDGSCNTGGWANGSGDGTLYGLSATVGGASGPSSVDFGSTSSATWTLNAPSTVGARATGRVTVTIYLKSTGRTVSSGYVDMIAQNGGVQN